MDFGGLKDLKEYLTFNFDHTTLVAVDDPKVSIFREMEIAGLIDLRVVPATGCEAFAFQVYTWISNWLQRQNPNVHLLEVQVHEHEGNSASYGYGQLTVEGVVQLAGGVYKDASRRGVLVTKR